MQWGALAIMNMKMQFDQIVGKRIPGEFLDEGTIKVYVPCLVKTQVSLGTVYIYVEFKLFSYAASLFAIHYVHHYILF